MDADRAVERLIGGDGARPSEACEDFVKGWESCRLTPYLDQAGRWTVGWGHLMQDTDPHVPISLAEADSLFQMDLLSVADSVARLIVMPLAQYQFDALVAFAFNVGTGALAGSTLRKLVNAGYFDRAAAQFAVWNKVRSPATGTYVESDGLSRRRAAERAIFVDGDYSGRP